MPATPSNFTSHLVGNALRSWHRVAYFFLAPTPKILVWGQGVGVYNFESILTRAAVATLSFFEMGNGL